MKRHVEIVSKEKEKEPNERKVHKRINWNNWKV
jgi:hypothetical protein